MKRITQKLMLALALSIVSMPAMAGVVTSTPTKFTPTTMKESNPLRFLVNLDSAMVFSGGQAGYLATGGQVGLMNIQLSLALIYNIGMGLDVGFGVHGGIQSPYSMFITPNPALPAGWNQYGMMFGADVMVRYLAMFSDMFYGGLQAQVGYNYTDSIPGVSTDATYAPFTSKTSANSFIPVVAGLVLGVDFKDAAVVYLFPAIELGQTSNVTNSPANAPTSPDTGIWKSAVGFQVGVGTAIHTGVGDIVIQATPRMANFSNQYSWGLDVTTGMYWDF